ncbi:hypothetical protein SPSIL_055840 [Sporomusa silvacetica DSM 10669]|uniref:Protein CotJB domain-containing protein n=1 Tax=Sporomusa silvacetica DSM 10669 TaxID=1123289 RepID=A0ABZ3IUE4_9FIRM|nr:spore coat protein CotJB [Sporomusa silvacetica]OZC13031.1 CotJB protein [Sporomusa silvacetica DSM 10669]
MKYEKQMMLLKKVQEIQFVAVELNLYLDTHPCDQDALNDYNCAVEMLKKYKEQYEREYGPLINFGHGGMSGEPWQWAQGPWPWEL